MGLDEILKEQASRSIGWYIFEHRKEKREEIKQDYIKYVASNVDPRERQQYIDYWESSLQDMFARIRRHYN